MTDTDLEQRLSQMFGRYAGRPIDTAESWRQFTRLRARSLRNSRRLVAAAAAMAAVALIASLTVVGHDLFRVTAPGGAGPSRPAIGHLAITARLPIAGAGVVVTGHGHQVWVLGDPDTLIRVDTATNRVMGSERIPGTTDLAAGIGALWVLTSEKAASAPYGQIVKLSPVTGRVEAAFALARPCERGQVAAAGRNLWLACGTSATEFALVDPATGRVVARAGGVRSVFNIAATPGAIWYTNQSGLSGFVAQGTRLRWRTVNDPGYPVSFAYANSLVSAAGMLWAFTNDESVAEINPATARVTRFYTYADYDPSDSLGLDFMTAGRGSLWFLDDDHSDATSVLRVSMATGKPQGIVAGAGSCGQPCSEIYFAAGSVWVPARARVTRVSPAPRNTGRR